MSGNFETTMAQPILEPVYLTSPALVDADAEPVLDETGNPVRDEVGEIVYGD